MALPLFKTALRELQMLQTQWKSQVDPLLANPTSNVSILKGVALKTGVNVINHKLGVTLQGWYFTDVNAAITAYRSAPKDDLTLTLTCSAPAICDLAVF